MMPASVSTIEENVQKRGNGGSFVPNKPGATAVRKGRVESQIDAFLSYLGEPVSPERHSGFVNNFPNLVAAPDEGYDILLGEQVRYRNAMRAVARSQMDARRRLNGVLDSKAIAEAGRRGFWEFIGRSYRLRDFDTDYREFVDCIKCARATINRLLDVYFPEQLRLELEMTSDVENADCPRDLLALCGRSGQDLLSRRTRLEAARQLTLGQIYLEMRRDGNSPDDLDVFMTELDAELKRWFFLPGRSACYEVAAELDPDNGYRVKDLCCALQKPGTPHLKSHESLAVMYPGMRFISGDVPVLYLMRIKQDAPLKQILKNRRNTLSVSDLLGIKLVFLNERDLMMGVEHMRRTAVCVPGTVYGEESNLYRSGVVNESNRFSSEEFRATSYHARILDRWYEFQFELLSDWINERCSSGRENHILYKTHSYLVELFPKLFPTSLYLDWASPEIRLSVARLQIARIWS